MDDCRRGCLVCGLRRGGGIEWTIKEGIPYHVPTLMKEVKAMVEEARAARAKKTRQPEDE